MKPNLKEFPQANFTMRASEKRKDKFILAVVDWEAEFRKELQHFKQNPVKLGEWIRQNSDVKTTGELLKRFINKVILGENQIIQQNTPIIMKRKGENQHGSC